jgi:photosystem II stability/assembly factor-like uncharacterized protein
MEMISDYRRRVVIALLGSLVASIACGGDSAPVSTAPPAVATVEVSPATLPLVVGQTGALTAQLRDRSGVLLSNRSVTWTSSNAAVATVSVTGTVMGAAPGTTTVIATSEGKSGAATVTVVPAPVATVVVNPNPVTLRVGQTATLTATLLDQTGGVLTGRPLAWSSSDTAVASVSASGVVTGAAPGTAAIAAASEGKVGTAAITVTASTPTISIGPWTGLGPHHINGPFGSVASGKLQAVAVFAADPNIIYAGGGLGSGNEGPFTEAGAFKSTNGGDTWSRIGAGLSDPIVNAMWVDDANSNLVVAGTETGGIFRSTDGGQTWSVAASLGAASEFVSTAGTLLAATAAGVAQSTDKGRTWSMALSTTSPARALAAGGGAVIVGLENGTIMMQPSPGASWQTVRANAGRTAWSVAIDPANPRTAFALLGYHPSTLLATSDGGSTWSTLAPCDLAQALAMTAASHALYVGCNGAVARTSDGGQSWTRLPNVGWDIRRLLLLSGESSIVIGSDQGLYRTSNGGATWASVSSSVYSSILTNFTVRGPTILTAVQDFSPILTFDGGTTWQQPVVNSPSPPVGEDGQVLINPSNASYCYAYTTAGYQYSTDGCRTFRTTGLPALGFVTYVGAGGADIVAVDPRAPATVYVASQSGVFRSTDWGVTMSPTNWPLQQPYAIAVDPTDSRAIYVGTNAKLFKTQDAGTTWTELGLAGAAGFPTTIAVDPRDPQVILVGLSQGPRRDGGVLRSTDRGKSFVRVNSGLGSQLSPCCGIDVFSLRFDASGAVAAAMSTGVFVSADLGDRWQDVTQNSPSHYITDVAWDGGKLYASSFGGGLLRADAAVVSSQAASMRGPDQTSSRRRAPLRRAMPQPSSSAAGRLR